MILEQHRLSDRAVRLACLNLTELGRNTECSSNFGSRFTLLEVRFSQFRRTDCFIVYKSAFEANVELVLLVVLVLLVEVTARCANAGD